MAFQRPVELDWREARSCSLWSHVVRFPESDWVWLCGDCGGDSDWQGEGMGVDLPGRQSLDRLVVSGSTGFGLVLAALGWSQSGSGVLLQGWWVHRQLE